MLVLRMEQWILPSLMLWKATETAQQGRCAWSVRGADFDEDDQIVLGDKRVNV